jgi:hypothetical protein
VPRAPRSSAPEMSRPNPEGTLAHGAREPRLGGQPEPSTNPDRTAASLQPLLAPPYVIFGREQWAALRGRASMALSEVELPALAGVNDPASLADVNEVFLPLVRLIDLHIAAARSLGSMVGEAVVGQRRTIPPYVAAIAAMEEAIDRRALRLPGNDPVMDLAEQTKAQCRQAIREPQHDDGAGEAEAERPTPFLH